jgi:phosphoribosylformylglycinamidine synthase
MRARVIVTLKSGVLDPQGQAIEGSLRALGFAGIGGVRQGKIFDVELAEADAVAAERSLKDMCEKLLANTVIENYAIELVPAGGPKAPLGDSAEDEAPARTADDDPPGGAASPPDGAEARSPHQ